MLIPFNQDGQVSMKKGEVVFSAVCVVFFGFMAVQTLELLGKGRPSEMGSGSWPMLLLSAGAMLSLGLLALNLIKFLKKRNAGEARIPAGAAGGAGEDGAAASVRKKVSLCIVALLLYILILPYAGFVLSTGLFALGCMWALEERRPWVLVGSPILITALVLVVFAKFISMPLPKGVGLFADFSRLFY